MKLIINRVLILVFFIASFSCNKKYPKDYINGTITEYGSNIPIGNATVILESTEGQTTHYDSIYTDNAGKFGFSESLKKGPSYSLKIREDKHYGNYLAITNNLNPPYDASLPAFAYLKLRIKKNNSDSNHILVHVNTTVLTDYVNVLKKFAAFDTILPVIIKIPAKRTIGIGWQVLTWPTFSGVLSSSDFFGVTVNKGDTLTYFIQTD